MHALLVVDAQNDFVDPRGGLAIADAEPVIDKINDLIELGRVYGHFDVVVYTQDWHPAETPHFADFGGPWPVHCVAGTWGAELHPRLVVDSNIVIKKGVGGEDGYSAFTVRDDKGNDYPTDLDKILRDIGVTEVTFVGFALDVCVKSSGLDSVRLGYKTNVALDATAAVDKLNGERAVLELVRAGVHIV